MKLINTIKFVNNFCHPAMMIIGVDLDGNMAREGLVDINVEGTPDYLIKTFDKSDLNVKISDLCFVSNRNGDYIPYPRFSYLSLTTSYVTFDQNQDVEKKIMDGCPTWDFPFLDILQVLKGIDNQVRIRGFVEDNPSEFIDFTFSSFEDLVEFVPNYDFSKWYVYDIIPYCDFDAADGMDYFTICCTIQKGK